MNYSHGSTRVNGIITPEAVEAIIKARTLGSMRQAINLSLIEKRFARMNLDEAIAKRLAHDCEAAGWTVKLFCPGPGFPTSFLVCNHNFVAVSKDSSQCTICKEVEEP